MSYIGKDTVITKLLPELKTLLNEENFDVKLNAIDAIPKFAKVIGPEFITDEIKNLLDK